MLEDWRHLWDSFKKVLGSNLLSNTSCFMWTIKMNAFLSNDSEAGDFVIRARFSFT